MEEGNLVEIDLVRIPSAVCCSLLLMSVEYLSVGIMALYNIHYCNEGCILTADIQWGWCIRPSTEHSFSLSLII